MEKDVKDLKEVNSEDIFNSNVQPKKLINSVVSVSLEYSDDKDIVNLLEYSDDDLHRDLDLEFKKSISSVEATDEELITIRKALIGDLVRQLEMMMVNQDMTRASLARKLKVSKANITLMFSGEINMSINAILKFIKAINPSATLVLNVVE